MKKKLRKPSPAMIVACLALFVALGPAAYASHELILSSDIVNGEVKTEDLANSAVTNTKLANNTVGTFKIVNGQVGSADLQDGGIVSVDIATGGVAAGDLAANSVNSGKVVDNALTGNDVLESSLSKVPDADMLDGLDSTAFATQATVAALEARVAELEATLAAVSYDSGAKIFRFDGVNVQIVDGSGDTLGTPNGFGNLIVGYNGDAEANEIRTGSHNLVIGDEHTYSSFGGIVAGLSNSITGDSASVIGGEHNDASGSLASISGGTLNDATGSLASISGGSSNDATGQASSVSGGSINTASGNFASVSGGIGNTASGGLAAVSGGQSNIASGQVASVSGGESNTASAGSQWLAGTLNIRTATVTVPGGTGNNSHWNTAAQQAVCDAGHLLLSGGAYWNTDVDDEELPLIYSRALGGLNGWRARGGSDVSSDRTLTVQALCLGP